MPISMRNVEFFLYKCTVLNFFKILGWSRNLIPPRQYLWNKIK